MFNTPQAMGRDCLIVGSVCLLDYNCWGSLIFGLLLLLFGVFDCWVITIVGSE
jgi:hypothetical protein